MILASSNQRNEQTLIAEINENMKKAMQGYVNDPITPRTLALLKDIVSEHFKHLKLHPEVLDIVVTGHPTDRDKINVDITLSAPILENQYE